MEKYSRYTDEKNRLHVVVSRWASVEKVGEQFTLVPQRIELLDVHAEKVNDIAAGDFERYVANGLLKRVL